jgi:hypothetical protein
MPLVCAGDNEVRLLFARHLDQSHVGAAEAWFNANTGDTFPQQGTHPFR